MKLYFLSIIFITNICFADSIKLLKGGIDGGGADHYNSSYGSAWFLKGEKTHIDICLNIKEGMSVSKSKVKTIIKNIYNKWDQYIIDNTLYDQTTKEVMKIETKINFISDCEESDLKIYIGIINEEIIDLKEKFNNPMAFTYRNKYENKKGWSKGVIWLNENITNWAGKLTDVWGLGNNLYMILLHEIGHTFGNAHKPQTIMDRNIVNSIYTIYAKSN